MLDLKHVELKYTKAELLYGLVTVVELGCILSWESEK